MNTNEQIIIQTVVHNFMRSVNKGYFDFISSNAWDLKRDAIINAFENLFVLLSTATSDLDKCNLLTEFHNNHRSHWESHRSLSEPVDAVLAYIAEKFIRNEDNDRLIVLYLDGTVHRYRSEPGKKNVEKLIQKLRTETANHVPAVVTHSTNSGILQAGVYATDAIRDVPATSATITNANR